MKRVILSFILISLFSVVSCDEPKSTEPIIILKDLTYPTVKEDINLCCRVNDPFLGSCQVVGTVTYSHQIIGSQPESKNLYQIRIQINMKAQLCDRLGRVHPELGINGSSEDAIYVSEEGIYVMQKAYAICNRNDCYLVVQYLITTEGIGIPSMWITFTDGEFIKHS